MDDKECVRREELPHIISESVRQALMELGIDVTDPIAMQHDMQHLRAWRTSTQKVTQEGILTVFKILIVGTMGLIAAGLWYKHQ